MVPKDSKHLYVKTKEPSTDGTAHFAVLGERPW